MKIPKVNKPTLEGAAIVLLVILGAVHYNYKWILNNRDYDENALEIARSVEASLPVEDIKLLATAPDSIGALKSQAIKTRLKSIVRVNSGTRSAYIYTLQKGKLSVMADSEPKNPREFLNAADAFRQPFIDGKEIVAEYGKNNSGSGESILVPLKDEADGKTFAVLVMEYNEGIGESALAKKVAESLVLLLIWMLTIYSLFKIRCKNRLLQQEIAERKQVEEKLTHSLSLLNASLESTADGILVVSREGKIIRFNHKFADMWQIPNEILEEKADEEALGHVIDQIEQPHEFLAKVRHLYENPEESSFDLVHLTDGRIFKRFSQPQRIGEEIVGRVWSFRDVTEHKRAEESLRQSDAKHSSMIANISDVIIIVDKEGILKYISPNIEKFFGWVPEYLVGTSSWATVHPDDLENMRNEFYKLLQVDNAVKTMDFRLKCKDGSYRLIELTGVNLVNDPVIKGVLMNYYDVTDRRKFENELKESELRIRALLSANPDMMFVIDKDGVFVDYYAGNDQTLYASPDNFLGKKISDVLPPEVAGLAEKHTDILKSTGQMQIFKYQLMINGEKIDYECRLALNGISNTLAIISNITDRKVAEEELLRAKEKAEESDRLKSAFLANMSHEIRTPMNGILGFAELLKEPGLTGEEQQEYISIIERSGTRMLNIINDIVEISKIESGLMAVNRKETNVNEQIEYLYTFFKPEIEAKGMKFSYRTGLSSNDAVLTTDREKLYAILINLIKNAIKYSDTGSIELGYEKKGNYLHFYVKDTGIGIPENQLEAVFNRFVQVDMGDKRAFQGAGLGLSISKAYVEMLGGKIWVESEECKGSTFYFTLSLKGETEDNAGSNNNANESIHENQIKSLKILIAEDDELSAILLSKAVKRYAREVIKVDSGKEAVEVCRNRPDIDLVMMDIQLPEMNGYEATREIRQFNDNIIIIAQTAYALSHDREKALASGCNGYISKPFNHAALAKLMKTHFQELDQELIIS
jgi:PAS domain S-box-containing protein